VKKSLLLISALLLNAQDINKEFAKKYLSNMNTYKQEINQSGMLNKMKRATSSFNLKTHMDKNESKKYTKDFNIGKSSEADQIANEVNNITKSEKFNENVKGMERYILSDKGFNYKAYMGQYSKLADEVIKGKIKQNNFLSDKEKVYVVISSSMPIDTIQNYFKEVQPVRTDIVFVMRGFIGNISHIKPTLKWIKKAMTKPNCHEKDNKKCMYRINLEINPKVTEHFNINEVPAVIFVRNYNGFLDKYQVLPKKSDEEAYIAYGDANIIYALEKIDKKAKDKYLEKMIKALHKNWFSK
jgi:type-F conjugative transfer system pilin assembly protein TrbC